jgi:hypothetical protein
MGAVAGARSLGGGEVDPPSAVRERLEAFAAEVLAEAMNRPVRLVNGELSVRGLLERGPRESLEPMVARLGGDADYQSLLQFVADGPWDPALVVKAVAELVGALARMRRKTEPDDKQLKGRARTRPPRGPLPARVAPPHRPDHRRPRVSHPRATEPLSPAAGPTLPKAVPPMQPISKCRTGRRQTCQQHIDLTRLPLPLPRRDERTQQSTINRRRRSRPLCNSLHASRRRR